MKNIILAGLKHSGKSTLGKALGLRNFGTFLDLDDLLSLQDPLKRGLTAREIYRDLGKETFLEWETAAAQGAVNQKEPWILALGGGTIQNPLATKALEGKGLKIFLQEESQVLFDRIMEGGLPAFLSPVNPWQDFKELYTLRSALLDKWCDLKLNINGASLEKALEMLINLIEENNYGR